MLSELKQVIFEFAFGSLLQISRKLNFCNDYEFFFLHIIRTSIHPYLMTSSVTLKLASCIELPNPLRRDMPYFPLYALNEVNITRPFAIPFIRQVTNYLKPSKCRILKTYPKIIQKRSGRLFYGLPEWNRFFFYFQENAELLKMSSYLTYSETQQYLVRRFLTAMQLSRPLPELLYLF